MDNFKHYGLEDIVIFAQNGSVSLEKVMDIRNAIAESNIDYLSPNIRTILHNSQNMRKMDVEDVNYMGIDNSIETKSFAFWTDSVIDSKVEMTDLKRNQLVDMIKQKSISVHQEMCRLSNSEFKLQYKASLSNLRNPILIEEIHDQIKNLGCSLLPLSLLMPLFERTLADIWYSCEIGSSGGKSDEYGSSGAPFLAQLIVSSRMKEALGQPLCCFCDCILGSPLGLNIRNLAWHGFLNLNTTPVEIVSFSLVLLLTIAATPVAKTVSEMIEVSKKGRITDDSSTLEKLDVDSIDISRTWDTPFQLDSDLKPNDWILSPNDVTGLIDRSVAVVPGRERIWLYALELYGKGEYHHALVLLLPQLEHSMRRLFIAAHNREILGPDQHEEDDVKVLSFSLAKLNAANDILYTTLDEITSPILEINCSSIGTQPMLNKFFNPRCEPHTSKLFPLPALLIRIYVDLFIWDDGPRVRDMIAHYQFRPVISQSLTFSVIMWALSLAIHFDPLRAVNDSAPYALPYEISLTTQLEVFTKKCRAKVPIFHPRVQLLRLQQVYFTEIIEGFEMIVNNRMDVLDNIGDYNRHIISIMRIAAGRVDGDGSSSSVIPVGNDALSLCSNMSLFIRKERIRSMSMFPDTREMSVITALTKILEMGRHMFANYKIHITTTEQNIADRTASSRFRRAYTKLIQSLHMVTLRVSICWLISTLVDCLLMEYPSPSMSHEVILKFVLRCQGLVDRQRVLVEEKRYQKADDILLGEVIGVICKWMEKYL